jgi:hypothetical protein
MDFEGRSIQRKEELVKPKLPKPEELRVVYLRKWKGLLILAPIVFIGSEFEGKGVFCCQKG